MLLWRSGEFRGERWEGLEETPREQQQLGLGMGRRRDTGVGSRLFPTLPQGSLYITRLLSHRFLLFFWKQFSQHHSSCLHPLLVTGAREVPFLPFPRQPSTFAFQMIQGLGGGRSSLPLYPASLPHSHSPPQWAKSCGPASRRNLGDQMPCLASAPILDPHILRPGVRFGLRAPGSCLQVPVLDFRPGLLSPHCSLGGGGRAGPLSRRHPGNLEMALATPPPRPKNRAYGGLASPLTLNVFREG